MATANFVLARCTRAASIAGRPTPWSEALALSLTELAECAPPIFAAHLRAESLWAGFTAASSNIPILATAFCTLQLLVEKARALSRAAHLAAVKEARALCHTLWPSASTGALTLGWIGRTAACAIKCRCSLVKSHVFSKLTQACASTASSIGVIANIQVIPIVPHKMLWLVQRFEADSPTISQTWSHAKCCLG